MLYGFVHQSRSRCSCWLCVLRFVSVFYSFDIMLLYFFLSSICQAIFCMLFFLCPCRLLSYTAVSFFLDANLHTLHIYNFFSLIGLLFDIRQEFEVLNTILRLKWHPICLIMSKNPYTYVRIVEPTTSRCFPLSSKSPVI